MSVLVFFDMVDKLVGGTDKTWSPLRILGPPLWLPLKNTAGKLMAVQTLVHSAMYFVACYYLVQSRYRKNVRLMGPWVVMHCFFMVYQIVLVMENRDDYPFWEIVLGLSDFLLHVVLLLSACWTGIHWTPSTPPRRGAADAPEGTELQPLNGSPENPDSAGHSAETEEVTDERWSEPPPPSYDVAIRTPSHATGDSSVAMQQYQGGAMNVSWPWRWRMFREAARSAAAAAAADPTAGGIEMQIFAMMSGEPQASSAAVGLAGEPQASGAVAVLTGEPEVSGAAATVSDEPLESGGEVVAAATELNMPVASEERVARRTGWLSRWRLSSVLGGARAEEQPAGAGQMVARRRRSAGGTEPAAEQPLLQPSQ